MSNEYRWPILSQDFMARLVDALTPQGFMPDDLAGQVRFWRVVLSGPRGADNIGRPIVAVGLNGGHVPPCCTVEYAADKLAALLPELPKAERLAVERECATALPMPHLRAWCVARAEARTADTRGKSSLRLRRQAAAARGRARGVELDAIRWATAQLLADAGAVDPLTLYREAREAMQAQGARA